MSRTDQPFPALQSKAASNPSRRRTLSIALAAVFSFVSFLTQPAMASEGDAERQLTEFAAAAKIDFWPALKNCGYAEAFGDRRAGLWLKVADSGRADARWDGACRVPAYHEITGWPADLPAGEYIVAATADSARNGGFPEGNRHLRIEAVMARSSVDRAQLYRALMKRVCAGQGNAPTDKACRELPATDGERR